MRTVSHWIAGKEYGSDPQRCSPVWNPATGEQQSWVALAGAAEVDHAVKVAAQAFESWSQVSLSRRTRILFAFRELVNASARLIAEAISDEHGKVISDAEGEVQRGLGAVEFACGIPTLLKGDYSDQVSNVVHGDKVTVDALLDHPNVAAISFIGSTPIAQYIYARDTAAGKRVQALGGAKNHAIILPDADQAFAAEQLASAAFGSAGERCMAISAAVTIGSGGDDLVEAVSAKAKWRITPSEGGKSRCSVTSTFTGQNGFHSTPVQKSLLTLAPCGVGGCRLILLSGGKLRISLTSNDVDTGN